MRLFIAAISTAVLFSPAAHAQSAENGKKVFRKCMSCHQVGDEARNRTGPVLTGVIGRQAGSYEGFRYSAGLAQAGADGLVWDADTLFEWLADPTAFLRTRLDDSSLRAKMTFKLVDEDDRRDVIAYLGTFTTAALAPGGVCVSNGSDEAHLFAVETREGARKLAELSPGDTLCSDASAASDGIVSVYESIDAFEGCSRIVPAGATEKMLAYAEFDRCHWSSHG